MTPKQTFPARPSGFTLIELMITVTVAAILLAVAVPSFTDTIRNNRLTAASNDLLRSTQLARSEAVKRQSTVVVCAATDAMADQPTCSKGAFSQWIVFVDADGDWIPDNNAAEPVIDRHAALASTVTVRNDNDGIVSYAATGFARPAGAQTPSQNIVICDQRGNQSIGTYSTARALVIGATGRIHVTKDHTEIGTMLAKTGACPS